MTGQRHSLWHERNKNASNRNWNRRCQRQLEFDKIIRLLKIEQHSSWMNCKFRCECFLAINFNVKWHDDGKRKSRFGRMKEKQWQLWLPLDLLRAVIMCRALPIAYLCKRQYPRLLWHYKWNGKSAQKTGNPVNAISVPNERELRHSASIDHSNCCCELTRCTNQCSRFSFGPFSPK